MVSFMVFGDSIHEVGFGVVIGRVTTTGPLLWLKEALRVREDGSIAVVCAWIVLFVRHV